MNESPVLDYVLRIRDHSHLKQQQSNFEQLKRPAYMQVITVYNTSELLVTSL